MAGHLQTLQPQPPSTDPGPGRDSKGRGKSALQTAPGHYVPRLARPSDYNIWLDADLRCRLNACLRDEDDAGCMSPHFLTYLHCMPPQSYPSTTTSADPRFAVHSHCTPASNHPQPRWSKSSECTRTTPSRCACVSPAHNPRSYGDRASRGWTRGRWDDMRRTWFVSSIPPQPHRIFDPSTPGLNTTAISHRRGRCSFRRIAPLVLLGNRRRCSRRPRLRVQSISLDKPGDAKDTPSSRLRQNRTSRPCFVRGPGGAFQQTTSTSTRPPYERRAEVWAARSPQGASGRVERGVPRL